MAAVRGLDEMEAAIGRIQVAVRGALAEDLLAGAQLIADRAQELAVFSSGITAEATGETTAQVVARHPGAAVHEFGATITPKQARFLRFEVAGEEVFARAVRIPARPYMRPAVDQTQDEAIEAIGAAVRARIEGAA